MANGCEIGAARAPLRVTWFYDFDACRDPTGVTRHALAQLERLSRHPAVRLSVVSGRITDPAGRAYSQRLGDIPAHTIPLRTRDVLRWWRLVAWPPVESWTDRVDWVYCPAEFDVPTRSAQLAVTSHDILQDVRYGSPRRIARLRRIFSRADLVLSVSQYNTERLLETFPECAGRVAHVPNAAEDLFFEAASDSERAGVRQDLGLPEGTPYLLSVASFQPRKNLVRLVRVAARLAEVRSGEMGVVLLGAGSPEQKREIRQAMADAGPRALMVLPGYRQGVALRAAYAEAAALVFPSLCESFGIPAVEAMAQSVPVALADSTALPEIAGDAGWYFDPEDDESMLGALQQMRDQPDERARRVGLGRAIAGQFRWSRANDLLVEALRGVAKPPQGSGWKDRLRLRDRLRPRQSPFRSPSRSVDR